jgi:hypothetical protein
MKTKPQNIYKRSEIIDNLKTLNLLQIGFQ